MLHTIARPCRDSFSAIAVLLALLTACSPDEPPGEAAQEAPAPATDAVIYEGTRIIPGDGSAPIENGTFVVEDGRITAVGTEVQAPAGAARVDLEGTTVMPMMIDTHVHLNREREALIEDLRARARFGVSAAMSLGMDTGETVFEVQNETIPGAARYLTAGRGITRPEPGRTEIPHWVNTVEEARAAVREEASLGVDIIKIWVDDRGGQYEKLSPELYRAIIDEAHMNDLLVTAHIYYLEDAKELLRAGVDAFAHGIRDTDVDQEVIELFGQNPDVVLVPNLTGRGVAAGYSWLEGLIPDAQLQQLRENAADDPEQQEDFDLQARNLARLNDAGVRIALGTDGNTPWAPHVEIADMVTAGMTPAEAITAATSTAAEFVGLEDTGTIAPGMSADFIVLEANPLDDITNTRRIRDVYLRGDLVER